MHNWELSRKICNPIIAYFGAFETWSGARTIADWAEDAVTRSEHFYPKLIVLMVELNVFVKILFLALYSKLEIWEFNTLNLG